MEYDINCNENDLMWLAGLLEGEASFCKSPPSRTNCPRIYLEMTDFDVMDRVRIIFKRNKLQYLKPRQVHHKISYKICIQGKLAVLWMKKLYPHMMKRRKEQIIEAINDFDINYRKYSNIKRLKLKECEIAEIKLKHNSTSLRNIAKEYNVCHETIRRHLKNIDFQ